MFHHGGTGRGDCNGYFTLTTRGRDFSSPRRNFYSVLLYTHLFREKILSRFSSDSSENTGHALHLIPHKHGRALQPCARICPFSRGPTRLELVWERTALCTSLLVGVGVTQSDDTDQLWLFFAHPDDQTNTRNHWSLGPKGRETITVPTTVVQRPTANGCG